MPKVLLTLGTLKSITVLDPETGRKKNIAGRGRWLAWEPGRRKFHVCTVRGSTAARVPGNIARAHQRFHGVPPQGNPLLADAPTPSGPVRTLGLAEALVYTVPRKINSPGKNPHIWHHAFGDTGHKGGTYSQRVMPALATDSKGNLFFIRRKGNIFRVDNWLRG